MSEYVFSAGLSKMTSKGSLENIKSSSVLYPPVVIQGLNSLDSPEDNILLLFSNIFL
jgi:hypothetical protein